MKQMLIKTANKNTAESLSKMGFGYFTERISETEYYVFAYSRELAELISINFSNTDFLFSNKVCF